MRPLCCRVKAMPGRARAVVSRKALTGRSSPWSLFMNLRRTGKLANSRCTVMALPRRREACFFSCRAPSRKTAVPAAALVVVRRLQVDVGHLQDRRQGLAAKAQGQQAVQVLQLHQLGRAVALEGDLDVVGAEAAAVVLDAHHLLAPGAQLHGDLAGAGVDGVLHQFLDHGKGALDHLAGGDLAEHVLG